MTPIECSAIVALNPHHNDLAFVFDAYATQNAAAASFEVIVVSGGARQNAVNAFDAHRRRFPGTRLRLLNVDGGGRAAANNAGARSARSKLLLFIGDDFIPSPTLVRAHVELHRYAGNGCVAGIGPSFFPARLRHDPFRAWMEDSGQLFGTPFRLAMAHWPRTFFYAGNASVGRATFDRLDGFDESLHDTGDDFEFALRLREAGVFTHFLPKALAWHDHELTLAERVDVHRQSGGRARRIIARHGEIAQWRKFMSLPLADFAATAAAAEERQGVAPGAVNREARYQALLDLAFAEGFCVAAGGEARGSAASGP